MVNLMKDALNKAEKWGLPHGLSFVPEKTVAVFYHRKKNFDKTYGIIKNLEVNKTPIEYSTEAKFLGIILDQKLSFKSHLERKIIDAKMLLMRIKNAVGTIWGPTPKALMWAYKGIVFPMISYGQLFGPGPAKVLWSGQNWPS